VRITVFGAAGKVGRRVVSESLLRGHEVTAVVRDPSRLDELPAGVNVLAGDAENVDDVVAFSYGQDVVINATRSATSDEGQVVVRLNVESRGDETLMREKTSELLAFLDALPEPPRESATASLNRR